ncbi:MAG: SLC13 family permease [Peptococcaceae bacterium]|nr:SLC13 family permease [Peptococcaceae bacterium]
MKKNTFYIHIAVTLIIMFGFGLLPTIPPLTETGMNVVGIFLGLLYGWTFSEIVWASLLGMVALILTKTMTIVDVMAKGFGSDVTIMVLMIFFIIAIIDKSQLSSYISATLLSKKFLQGKPWLFSSILLFVSFLLGAFVSPVASVLLCWSIIYSVSEQLQIKPKSPYPTVMTIGIMLAALLGFGALPWQVVPLVVLGAYTNMTGVAINYLTYIIFYFPIAFVIIIAYILLCKYIFRINVSALIKLDVEKLFSQGKTTMTKQQKVVSFVVGLFVLLMLLPSILPADLIVSSYLKSLGACGITILMVVLMSWIKVDGQRLLEFQKDASAINWEVVILTAVVMPVSSLLSAEESGVTQFLLEKMHGILTLNSLFIFSFLVFLLSTIITNFCNNAVTGIMFLPLILQFAQSSGINALTIVIPMVMCIHLALLTPAACPASALLHANKEWCTLQDIYKTSIPIVLIAIVIISTLGYGLMSIIV